MKQPSFRRKKDGRNRDEGMVRPSGPHRKDARLALP